MRLKPGLFNLVPIEAGQPVPIVDNPYAIAQELAGKSFYCLSHGTAFEINRMVTQPNFIIHVSTLRRIWPQKVAGYPFHFIHVDPRQAFGVTKYQFDKDRFVMVSDPERTIIDGLRHPLWTNGITEVAKGLWMKHQTLKAPLLAEYALRLGVGSVIRRLGFLLESYKLADATVLESLRSKLTATYHRLDPTLPAEGAFLSRWRLQLNVTPEEIDAVRFG